jgi:hypothetical protein
MSPAQPPAVPRRLDRHFRWRGTEVSRLENFCDAVFAIVLALLFLRSAPPETFGELGAAMRALVPFAACFAIIAYVWIEHWLFARRFGLHDGVTTLLQLVMLFLLLFYAYPLKFVFTLIFVLLIGDLGTQTRERVLQSFGGSDDVARMFVWYGLGYGALFGVFALLYWRALHRAGELQLDRVERFLTRSGIVQCLLQTAVAVTSVAIAWTGLGLGVGLPGWIYCLIGPLLALHGVHEGRRLRALQRA